MNGVTDVAVERVTAVDAVEPARRHEVNFRVSSTQNGIGLQRTCATAARSLHSG